VTLGVGMELPFFNGQSKRPLLEARRPSWTRRGPTNARRWPRSAPKPLDWPAPGTRANEQILLYQQAIVPRRASVRRGAQRLSEPCGDFSTVIEDIRDVLDARASLARRGAERFTTWAELDRCLNSPATSPRAE